VDAKQVEENRRALGKEIAGNERVHTDLFVLFLYLRLVFGWTEPDS